MVVMATVNVFCGCSQRQCTLYVSAVPDSSNYLVVPDQLVNMNKTGCHRLEQDGTPIWPLLNPASKWLSAR